MELKKIEAAYVDSRGKIIDILDRIKIDCVTLITSKKGARRGDHYHKKSEQYLYLLSGRMQLITQEPDSEPKQTIIESGHLVYTPLLERHTFVSLEDSTFIVFTKGPRGGKTYEDDTYRLSEPLPVK